MFHDLFWFSLFATRCRVGVLRLVGERDLCAVEKKMWRAVLVGGKLRVLLSPRNFIRGGNLGPLIGVCFS